MECGVNDPLPQPIDDGSSKYFKIATNLDYSSIFKATGECNGSYMWFTTEDRSGTEYLISHSELNMKTSGNVGVNIPENADYIYFQFTNFNASTNVLQGLKITEIEGGGGSTPTITSQVITLAQNIAPSLTTGFYILGDNIYISSAYPSNLVFGVGEIVYYDSSAHAFYGDYNLVFLDSNGVWQVVENDRIDINSITNNRNKIPSSKAVYDAISNLGDAFYTSINDDIYFNLDGTINLFDSSTPMLTTSGFYKFNNNVYYYDLNGLSSAVWLDEAICYYDASTKELSITGVQKEGLKVYNCKLKYVNSTDGWSYDYDYFNQILDETKIETTISASSSNTMVAGAKAVYDALRSTAPVGVISNDIILVTNTVPAIDSGVYVLTNNSNIYLGSASQSNVVFGNGEIVYYDAVSHSFYGSFIEVLCDSVTGVWSIGQNEKIDSTSLSNSRMKFPTSLAVYDAIETGFIKASTSAPQTYTPSGTGTPNASLYTLSLNSSYGNCFQMTGDGHIKVLKNITVATIIGRANPYDMQTTAKSVGIAVRLKRNNTWSNIVSAELSTSEQTIALNLTEMISLQTNDEIAIGFFTQTAGIHSTSSAYLSIFANKI